MIFGFKIFIKTFIHVMRKEHFVQSLVEIASPAGLLVYQVSNSLKGETRQVWGERCLVAFVLAPGAHHSP